MHLLPIRKIVKPSKLELLIYFVMTLAIFVTSNWAAIIHEISQGAPIDSAAFSRSVSDQLSGISNARLVSIGTIVIFWSLVGLGVYTVCWLLINFIISLKNEVVVETDYVNKATFGDRVRVPLLQLLIAGIALGYAIIAVRFLYPLWLGIARIFFHNLQTIDLQLILLLIAATVGSCASLYIGWTMIKFIFAVRD